MNVDVKHFKRYVIGRRMAAVAAVFVVLVGLFMTMNYALLLTSDPLNTPALDRLAAELEQDPRNEELRQQLRELDLLARKAFFTRQWQIETGVLLLVGGVIVLGLSIQLMACSRRRIAEPLECPGLDDPWSAAGRARQVIAAGGLLAVAVVLATALQTRRQLQIPASAATAERAPAADIEAAMGSHAATVGWPRGHDTQWPSFRGVGGAGHAVGAEPPLHWDGGTGEGILWKSRIPREGFNSPVVWKDRVFLSGGDAEKREVYCYSADTGELLWTADTEGVDGAPETMPEVANNTAYAAPSPATDGNRVVALFATGVIVCLDSDGRRLWARALGVPDNHYGHSSSLLMYNDMVFVQYDHFGGSQLKALDVETGRTRWKVHRDADISWASPILLEAGGQMMLILSATPMVAAYDALTGQQLWRNDCLRGEIGASPAYAGGRVFAANQYATAVALNVLTGETIWTADRVEMPDAASPVATDAYLFLPTSFGTFSCVNAATGETVWTHDFDYGGYGSPILAGNRIYWVTENGATHIFRADGEFELLATSQLGEPSVSTPAMVGDRIYVRGSEHLFCIGGTAAHATREPAMR